MKDGSHLFRLVVMQFFLLLSPLLCASSGYTSLTLDQEPPANTEFLESPGQSATHSLHAIVPDGSRLVLLDHGEREWLYKFYTGVLFFDGWLEISEMILSQFPEEMREAKALFIEQLGMKIGMEWCKDNDIRRIDTDMLRDWGDRLELASEQNHLILTQVLREIDREVDLLLAR